MLENLALRHQLAVLKRYVPKPKLRRCCCSGTRPTGSGCWRWFSRGPPLVGIERVLETIQFRPVHNFIFCH